MTWALGDAAVTDIRVSLCAAVAGRQLSSDSVEEESGELRTAEDREHRLISERDKLRVTWNIERRCYFDSNGVKRSPPLCLSSFIITPHGQPTHTHNSIQPHTSTYTKLHRESKKQDT